jgi:hypothetical protein
VFDILRMLVSFVIAIVNAAAPPVPDWADSTPGTPSVQPAFACPRRFAWADALRRGKLSYVLERQ